MIGPRQAAILAELTALDEREGLTCTDLAARTGRNRDEIARALASLSRRRYAAALRWRYTSRNKTAVWAATGAGRRAFAARQQGAAS